MTSQLPQHRLLIQDENMNINHKKPLVEEKGKSKRTTTIGKGQKGLGIRKALGDITNKPTVQRELSTRTKNKPKEEFHISDEKFLHDHNKCIEAQKAAKDPCFLDTVLPGHPYMHNLNSVSFGSSVSSPAKNSTVDDWLKSQCTKADADSNNWYPEPEEMPMSEFSDWLNSSSQCDSPPRCDSPPSSPHEWEFEPVEFTLKDSPVHKASSCS